MTKVLLDIGAGSTEFARKFRKCNPSSPTTFLCGEPSWRGSWSGVRQPNSTECILARYDHFGVPDQSLDIVTLNAYHLFQPPHGIEAELIRTLVPGGLFISAHPIGVHPALPEEYFERATFTDKNGYESQNAVFSHRRRGWFFDVPCAVLRIGDDPVIWYPASRIICNRIGELRLPSDLRCQSSSYIYSFSEAGPTVRVWKRK